MSFSNPSMEMNLYKVEIVHDINLEKDGDLHILSNHIDSPFMNPEIFPSTRVGRWETRPHLENYVELDYGSYYKIKLFNYTWTDCVANVTINENHVGEWKIGARGQITIDRPLPPNERQPTFRQKDLFPLIEKNMFVQKETEWFNNNCENRFRFSKYGTQSDLIHVRFRPARWTENTLSNLMNGECKEMPIWSLNSTKDTLMFVRLVAARRYNPYPTVIGLREECPSYIS